MLKNILKQGTGRKRRGLPGLRAAIAGAAALSILAASPVLADTGGITYVEALVSPAEYLESLESGAYMSSAGGQAFVQAVMNSGTQAVQEGLPGGTADVTQGTPPAAQEAAAAQAAQEAAAAQASQEAAVVRPTQEAPAAQQDQEAAAAAQAAQEAAAAQAAQEAAAAQAAQEAAAAQAAQQAQGSQASVPGPGGRSGSSSYGGSGVSKASILNQTKGVRIYVSKKGRTLTLYRYDEPIASWPAAIGTFSDSGDKKQEGDSVTPSGNFYVCTRNDQSVCYLALGISYPAEDDAKRGLEDGIINEEQYREIVEANQNRRQPPWNTGLGGFVEIHGGGYHEGLTTHGCVEVDNAVMDVLWAYCPLGTPIDIGP